MVENSVGRLWLEGHPNEYLKSKWKYYVEEAEQDEEVEQQLISIRKGSEILKPDNIAVIDPCMGSGHILVYVFEVLMDIYVSEGYTEKDACESILKNNLYGLDIDKRAYQLAYFAVLMKARKYNRKILTKNISPLLCSIEETNSISEDFIHELILQDKTIEKDLKYIYSSFNDAKEYGSILNIKNINFENILNVVTSFELNKNNLNKFKYQNEIQIFKNIIKQAKILSINYNVVITNPPYMGNSGMNSNLKDYLKNNFPNSKSDLFAVFIEKCHKFSKINGFVAMITQQSFMFLSTFEKLRVKLINNHTIIDMAHLGAHAFDEIGGEVVQATSFINRSNFIENYNSTFHRLTEFNSESRKEEEFLNDKNMHVIKQNKFDKIPGSPMAYWVSDNLIDTFEKGITIDDISDFTGSQNITADNNKYLRYFWEINFNTLGKKWIKYAKGGNYKKYYGNIDLVVDWSDDARNFYKNNITSNLLDEKLWFKEGITYTAISSKGTGFRYMPPGCIFDKGGPSIVNIKNLYYCLGFLNSNLINYYLNILNPTINIQTKDIKAIPLIISSKYYDEIEKLSKINVFLTKEDWDEMELSFNFKYHPLINKTNQIEINFNEWKLNSKKRFNSMKNNEICLNKYFIEIYNIPEITSDVKNKDITLNQRNLINDIKSFISYVVGCMFGRYSLDNEGIQFAGGEFNINNYEKFIPDDDNIIPVLDTAYFDDDIVGYFTRFVETCFGSETLEENLDFIAGALSKTNKPSREIIRDYLLKNFFNDHKKTYKKCPIYWQFSSGKQNGFNCLVYMHRYEPSLVARIRTDYLHKTQKAIEQRIENNNNIINNSSSKQDVAKATKEKAKLQKQLKETQGYDEVLAHIANQNIEIDLDDGVKVNYAKFQNIEIKKEGSKTKKVNLLKKI